MLNLWERLDTLRAIVDTVRADEVEREPEAVRTRYEPYAEVYFVIEAVKRVEQRLIGELRGGKSVTGYISADFGYGKTATAIYLWKRCLDNEIVAVPPFLFRQLKDVMQATKGWLAYQLQHTHPELRQKLEESYRSRVERSAEELAKEIASRQGISEVKALAIVQQHIVQRRDVTTTQSLLDFLRDAAELAKEAGFKGLVVFADESQEFLRAEEAEVREAIQTLSELVKGIRGMANLPLGFILTMPVEPTEAAIEEQAGDIMQRMRERGTALKLQDAYGSEFPRDLWRYLTEQFGSEEAKHAVEDRTLVALGQLCERKDLSNGPRTVINAFKRIAHHYQQNRCPYTPINLIDDYLQGHIVFEGREAKLTNTLRRLLELPAVQRDPKRQQAVKLLAAFPRGVDEEKAGDLYKVIEDLADKEQWLGEHLTQLAEGYALVGLQERAEARPLLDEIIRDFRRRWHHTYSEIQKKQLATIGFLQEIIPMLFPPRGPGQYANFGGHRRRAQDFERSAQGVFYEVLEGCFERMFSRFPNRKVCISVSDNADALTRFQPPAEDIHLDFRFFLCFPSNEEEPTRIISPNQDRRVDFYLNMKRTFGRHFPSDLAFLRDIMAPERTSAQVLLALSIRMWGWLEEHPETSEADRQMIEAHRRALHRYALQLLLPDASDVAKVQAVGIKVSGAEQRLIESAFEAKCVELYPKYKPLMITKEWKNYLRRYRDALSRRPLAERRGRQPFSGSRDEVAALFGSTRSTFPSQATNLESMGLLEVKGWNSDTPNILFREHSLETLLRETLQREGWNKTVQVSGQTKSVKSIEISRLKDIAWKQGYLSDEVDEALELLVLRQYLQREPDGTVHEFAGAVDPEELKYQVQQLEEKLDQLATHFRNELRTHEELLHEAREHLTNPEDEVALDTAQRKLDELRVRLDEFIRSKAREEANRLAGLASELDRQSGELQPRELEQQVTGTVEFVRHVDDQRKALDRRFRELRKEWEQLKDNFKSAQQQAQVVGDEKALSAVLEKRRKLEAAKQNLDAELKHLQPYLTGLQCWREVVAKVTSLRERIDLNSPLRQQLDSEVTTAIMEHFATKQLEALLDWERFKADVDTIEAELNAEENRRRDEFLQNKERYEQALGKLITQRMIQATFDPRDPEQSYQVFYQNVMRKVQDWLNEQREIAQRVVNEFDYLIRERGIKVDDERSFAEQVLELINEAIERLNQDLIKNWKDFQQYCENLKEVQKQLHDVQQKLVKKRTEKEPPTDEEKPLLEALTTQRRSLEDLRRQLHLGQVTLDDLFACLKSLYRKGHIEIEVRKRE